MLQPVHIPQHDLQTYLTRLLPAEVDSVTDSHLRECGPCVARLTHWADFSATMREKPTLLPGGSREERQHCRFETNGSGMLQILHPFSSEWWDIRITNVSKGGMRLNVPIRVPLGSLVKVKMQNSLFFGETRYCEPVSDDLFYVGVQLHVLFPAVSTSS